MSLKAGIGVRDITPERMLPLFGYPSRAVTQRVSASRCRPRHCIFGVATAG